MTLRPEGSHSTARPTGKADHWTALTLAGLICILPVKVVADEVAEELFWSSIGSQINSAVNSYQEYRQERQLWSSKIADAEKWVENCGGCAAANEELEKWQGIEDTFNEFAAAAFHATGQPPAVAQFLGIEMGSLPSPGMLKSTYDAGEGLVQRPAWASDTSPECSNIANEYFLKIRSFQDQNRVSNIDGLIRPGAPFYDLRKLYVLCREGDQIGLTRELSIQKLRRQGLVIPETFADGLTRGVYYGALAEGIELPALSVDAARNWADGEGRQYQVIAKDSEIGSLVAMIVKGFHWSIASPDSKCFEGGNFRGEIAKRECDDLYELSAGAGLIIECQYSRSTDPFSPREASFYWFSERPEAALPQNLVTRSFRHPALFIGDPRTDCPSTKAEAEGVFRSYQNSITQARLDNPQIPESETLESEFKKRRQEEYERYNIETGGGTVIEP